MYKIALTILLVPVFLTASGQQSERSNVFNGANFLTFCPDARAGAMGSIGTSTAPDVYSIYWNAAKSVFNESNMEVSYTYSPWMREITDDMNLSSLGFFRKLGDNQAISAGFRYFSYGNIMFNDQTGENLGEHKPYELSADLSYSRKLGRELSAAVTLKYIHSQLGMGQMVSGVELDAANAFAADISVFFNRELSVAGKKSIWRAGLNMANIGSKLKYSDDATASYLPGDLRLGTSLQMDVDNRNSVQLAVEANSLMVPRAKDHEGANKSGVAGYFSSFGDIQNENLTWTVGAEYWYNKLAALRAGYHHNAKDSGRSTWFSMGLGVKYYNIMADFAYLIPTTNNSPMRNTLQFSIGVDLDFFKKKK